MIVEGALVLPWGDEQRKDRGRRDRNEERGRGHREMEN